MSTKYKHPKEVPLQVIVARLRELATVITKGRDSQEREFTMSIPAECDRDADIVINEAANRIGALQSQVAELESMVKVFRGCIDTQLLPKQASPCNVKIRQLVGDSNV